MIRSIAYTTVSTVLALVSLEMGLSSEEVPIEPVDKSRKARIVFVGDMMAHMPQVEMARNGSDYDFSKSFTYVKEIFSQSDLAIANLETSLSLNGPYSGYPAFKSPSEFIHDAVRAGIGMVTLANNHSLDNGTKGVVETIGIIDSLQIARTGIFNGESDRKIHHPLRISLNGIRFSIFNYTYGTNGIPERDSIIVNRLDTMEIAKDLDKPDTSDFRIAILHWGEEYAIRHNSRQRRIKEFFNGHGINIIVGTHPHVVQEIEYDTISLTMYSLGNFVSNQRNLNSDGGLIAVIDFEATDSTLKYSVTPIPVWVRKTDYAVIPYPMADSIKLNKSDRQASNRFFDNTISRINHDLGFNILPSEESIR